MSDIVKRLREIEQRDANHSFDWGQSAEDITGEIIEAADEIESLRARVAELEAAVLAEREACAKVCEDIERMGWKYVVNGNVIGYGASSCAAAIRARGAS